MFGHRSRSSPFSSSRPSAHHLSLATSNLTKSASYTSSIASPPFTSLDTNAIFAEATGSTGRSVTMRASPALSRVRDTSWRHSDPIGCSLGTSSLSYSSPMLSLSRPSSSLSSYSDFPPISSSPIKDLYSTSSSRRIRSPVMSSYTPLRSVSPITSRPGTPHIGTRSPHYVSSPRVSLKNSSHFGHYTPKTTYVRPVIRDRPILSNYIPSRPMRERKNTKYGGGIIRNRNLVKFRDHKADEKRVKGEISSRVKQLMDMPTPIGSPALRRRQLPTHSPIVCPSSSPALLPPNSPRTPRTPRTPLKELPSNSTPAINNLKVNKDHSETDAVKPETGSSYFLLN